MVLTRQDAKAAFHHVVDNVLERGNGTPLKSALQHDGIEDIFALVTIDDADIDGLTCEDSSNAGTRIPINKGDKNLIRIFRDYMVYRNNNGNPINDNWTGILQADFDAFRVDPTYVASRSRNPTSVGPTPQPANASVPLTASSSATKKSPAELFRRGIKRDPSLFPTLKDEKFNDSWHRSFANQARAQDLSDVLDSSYAPLIKFSSTTVLLYSLFRTLDA
jgi:hypothetical protein